MALFAVSFRVGMEGNSTQRRDSLVARIKFNASGPVWDETTSFLLLRSAKTAEELATDIYVNSDMNASYDQLVVINLSAKNFSKKGNLKFAVDLETLMALR